jgi:hypothetical protein
VADDGKSRELFEAYVRRGFRWRFGAAGELSRREFAGQLEQVFGEGGLGTKRVRGLFLCGGSVDSG